MNDQLDTLLGKLKLLEDELLVEMHAKEKQFSYTVREGKVHFTENATHAHHLLAKNLRATGAMPSGRATSRRP